MASPCPVSLQSAAVHSIKDGKCTVGTFHDEVLYFIKSSGNISLCATEKRNKKEKRDEESSCYHSKVQLLCNIGLFIVIISNFVH